MTRLNWPEDLYLGMSGERLRLFTVEGELIELEEEKRRLKELPQERAERLRELGVDEGG